jgi:hypothetical protein
MSANDGRWNSDMIQPSVSEDADFVAPSSELNDLSRDSDLTQIPPTSDLVERVNDAGWASGDDRVLQVTDDDFVTSGDIAGDDVVDFGIASDASLGGLGTNIDNLPGDETPISRENLQTDL